MTEFTGRTVAEAIETGLKALGLSQEDAEIEIVDEGRGGVFGLGTKPARVRISARAEKQSAAQALSDEPAVADVEPAAIPEPSQVSEEPVSSPPPAADDAAASPALSEEPAVAEAADEERDKTIEICEDFLQNLLQHMGLKTTITTTVEETDDEDKPLYLLNIEGEDLSTLIGRRGETLDAIQYIVRLVVNRHTHSWPRIEVDVENYKQRRALTLERLALNMADRAVRDGRTVVLEAMPARERRLIHLALRDREDVTTQSIGEGDNRKVTIIPT